MSRAALSMMCTDLIDADPAQSENMDSLITRTMAIVEVHLHSSNCGVVVVHKLGTLRETTKSPFFFALTSQSKRQLGDQVVNGDTFQLQTFNDQYACNLSMTQTSIPIQHIDVSTTRSLHTASFGLNMLNDGTYGSNKIWISKQEHCTLAQCSTYWIGWIQGYLEHKLYWEYPKGVASSRLAILLQSLQHVKESSVVYRLG
ncbi:predicted protein [Lichtheimia corymbifera JMRC:FSU:9682]|uniref:Uncharacterized protein n=1 Tax=Lichtheimia corymbifera JMRC:FSU:9682 TaxID=1263082 RepID=A0A068RW85_9FUNG|nr:predicted protein [Lichtheimia corymbifera JMRC:FSU:9682]